MVQITTFGGSGNERMAESASRARSKGICTYMTTTSGATSRARRRASASFGTSATTSIAP